MGSESTFLICINPVNKNKIHAVHLNKIQNKKKKRVFVLEGKVIHPEQKKRFCKN